MLTPIEIDKQIAKLLQNYPHAKFFMASSSEKVKASHRNMALYTLSRLKKYKQVYHPEHICRVYPEKIQQTVINRQNFIPAADFWGSFFDEKNRLLLEANSYVLSYPNPAHNLQFAQQLAAKQAHWDNVLKNEYAGVFKDGSVKGFAEAMIYPPYNLRDRVNVQERFLQIVDYFFGAHNLAHLHAVAWPSSSSSYFIRDWWGDLFFTIYNKEKDAYVSILLTATD